MKIYLMALTVWVFLPILTSRADTDSLQISYTQSQLTFSTGSVREVRIDYRAPAPKNEGLSLITPAHAAPPPFKAQDFYTIYDHLNNAFRLNDLKPYITDAYYDQLQARIKAGASSHAVMAMLQAMRPQKAAILESKIDDTHAELILTGRSNLGVMRGRVHLVGTDAGWRVEREQWYVGGKEKKDSFGASYDMLSGRTTQVHPAQVDMMSSVSPDYVINRNFLDLTKISKSRRKQSVMFVFLMNGKKDNTEEQQGIGRLLPKQTLFHYDAMDKNHQRNRLHVMWTGPKKILKDQKVIENEYPVDLSIARYDDGYAPGEWNMVLPNKKPREVAVSLMWSF